MNLIIINLGVWGYSPTSKMEKNKRYNSSILISFLVSAYALTVLATLRYFTFLKFYDTR